MMQPKKRLSRRDPSYYVPLPYAMAIKRCLDEDVFELHLFNGMQLGLAVEGDQHNHCYNGPFQSAGPCNRIYSQRYGVKNTGTCRT